jgi:hypothetical protein
MRTTEERGNGKQKKAEKAGKYTKKSYSRQRPEDVTELSILCTYLIQQRGGATIGDLITIFKEELNITVTDKLLTFVLECLKDRDFVAAIHRDGEWVWKIKKIKFNCSIEVPHVRGMINRLEDDPAGIAIKAEMEGAIASKSKKATTYPKSYAAFEARFMLLSPFYGGQPYSASPQLQRLVAESPHQFKATKGEGPQALDGKQRDSLLVFERAPNKTLPDGTVLGEGEIVIHSACVRGFIQTHLRVAGKSPAHCKLFGVEEIRVKPELGLELAAHPIIVHGNDVSWEWGKGAGVAYYEALQAGEILTLKFLAPTQNFLTPKQYEAWLERVFRSPARSMSPARGVQTGRAKLVSLEHTMVGIDSLEETGDPETTN